VLCFVCVVVVVGIYIYVYDECRKVFCLFDECVCFVCKEERHVLRE